MKLGITIDRIENLQGWWRADKVEKNGSNIFSMTDLSGNNRPLIQDDPTKQPSSNENDLDFSGHKSVEFDGISEYLYADGIGGIISGTNKPYTIVLLIRKTSSVSGAGFWGFGNSADIGYIEGSISGTQPKVAKLPDSGSEKSLTITPTIPPSEIPIIVSWKDSGTEAIVKIEENELGFLRNEEGGSGVDLDVGSIITLDRFTIGALRKNGSATNHMAYRFSEAMVFDRKLTDDEMTFISNYLTGRYLIDWKPSKVNQLRGLFRFDSEYITLNGSDVSSISPWGKDWLVSLEATDLVQATPLDQPLYNGNDSNFNNRGSISLDGINDFLSTPAIGNIGHANPTSVVMIIKRDSISTEEVWWSNPGLNNSSYKEEFGVTSGNNITYVRSDNLGSDVLTTSFEISQDTLLIASTFSTAYPQIIWNGIVKAIGGTNGANVRGEFNNLYIGKSIWDGKFSNITIAEIAIYSTVLSNEDLNNFNLYAKKRYGVTSTTLPVLTNCIQDLDANEGIILDGITSRVETWGDQLGIANATQTTDANQPEFTASNINFNGYPTVNGNGTSYHMRMDALATSLTGDDKPFYICFAARHVTNETDPVYFAMNRGGDATHYHYLQNLSTTSFNSRRRAGDTETNASSSTVPDTKPHIFEYIFTGTSVTMRIDGVDIINEAQDNATITLTTATLFSFLGSGTTPSNHSDIEIARWAIFDVIPNGAEQTTLRNYMSSLYGIVF